VIHFLALGLRMMSFDMDFLLPKPKKISHLCIKLNIFVIDLMLQLKISHELIDIVVIDMF
jgi:hypothetical protein